MNLKTKRLILRPWREEDLEPFAKLNANPKVMGYFPATLCREESDALAQKITTRIDELGWGLWAVSILDVADFIGFIGLSKVPFTSHFTPAVEIGWRLAHEYWGHGYGGEGALEALHFGFTKLNLEEIVSFAAVQNRHSIALMKKIGMHSNPSDDFDHPKLPRGHQLRNHVL